MPTATAYGPSKAATHVALNNLTQKSNAKAVSLPLFPGENLEMSASKPAPIPRGLIETDFVPRQGNLNLTKEMPEIPLQAPARLTKMPAKIGADWSNSAALDMAAAAYMAWVDNWFANILGQFLKDMVVEDLALIQATVQSTKTFTAQRAENAMRPPKKCKDDDDKGETVRRFRIHGYSRKGGGKVNPRGPNRPRRGQANNLPDHQRVVSTRDLSQAIRQTMHCLTVDCIASNASRPGNGAVATDQAVVDLSSSRPVIAGPEHFNADSSIVYPANGGDATDKTAWKAWFPDSPPGIDITTPTPNLPMVISASHGRARLIPLDHAKEVASNALDVWADRIDNTLRSRDGYRAWNYRMMVRDRLETYRWQMWDALDSVTYPNSKDKGRRGPQKISTRRYVAGIPPLQYFMFSGHPAIRFPRGRVPLPEAEWIRRYRARKAKQRKTNQTRKSKKPLKVPKTRYGRPHTILRPGSTPK